MHWESLRLFGERAVETDSLHGRFSFSSKDQTIGRSLYLSREYSITDIESACRILTEENQLDPSGNYLLLDVGAGIGTTSIPLVRRGLFHTAWAFEPCADQAAYLERNIGLNSLEEQIRIFPCTLAERSTADDVLTLDGLAAFAETENRKISLIWLDVHGQEGLILRGGQRAFEQKIPLVTEFWPEGNEKSGVSARELCALLRSGHRFFYDLTDRSPSRRSTSELPYLYECCLRARSYTKLVLIP